MLHRWLPAFGGAVACTRAFGRDVHALDDRGDRGMLMLYVVLLVLLSLLAALPVGSAAQMF